MKPILNTTTTIKHRQRGFSLVEVLISIALVGVVATLFVTVQKNASDLNRVSDLRAGMQNASSIYQNTLANQNNCTMTMEQNFIIAGETAVHEREITSIVNWVDDVEDPTTAENLYDADGANPRQRGVFPGFQVDGMRVVLPDQLGVNSTTATGAFANDMPSLEITYVTNSALDPGSGSATLTGQTYVKRVPLFINVDDAGVFQGCISEGFLAETLTEQLCELHGGQFDPVTSECQNVIQALACPANQIPNPNPAVPGDFVCVNAPNELPACPTGMLVEVAGNEFRCVEPLAPGSCPTGTAPTLRKNGVNAQFVCEDVFTDPADTLICPKEGQYMVYDDANDTYNCQRFEDTNINALSQNLTELLTILKTNTLTQPLTIESIEELIQETNNPGTNENACLAFPGIDMSTVCFNNLAYVGTDGRTCGTKVDGCGGGTPPPPVVGCDQYTAITDWSTICTDDPSYPDGNGGFCGTKDCTTEPRVCVGGPTIVPPDLESATCRRGEKRATGTCTITATTQDCKAEQMETCRNEEYNIFVSETVFEKVETAVCGGCTEPAAITFTNVTDHRGIIARDQTINAIPRGGRIALGDRLDLPDLRGFNALTIKNVLPFRKSSNIIPCKDAGENPATATRIQTSLSCKMDGSLEVRIVNHFCKEQR